MDKIWKKYVKTLPYTSEFLHKDEFEKKYPAITSHYPAVFLVGSNNYVCLMSPIDFENMSDVAELMNTVSRRLKVSRSIKTK